MAPKDEPFLDIYDPFVITTYVYTFGSTILLVLVFFLILPAGMLPFLKRIEYVQSINRLEAEYRHDTNKSVRGPVILCQVATSRLVLESDSYTVNHLPYEHCTHVILPLIGVSDWVNDMFNMDNYMIESPNPALYTQLYSLRKMYNFKLLFSIGTTVSISQTIFTVSDNYRLFGRNVIRWMLAHRMDGMAIGGLLPAPVIYRRPVIRLLKLLHSLLYVQGRILIITVPPDTPLFSVQNPYAVRFASMIDYLVIEPCTHHSEAFTLTCFSRSIVQAVQSGVPREKLVASFSTTGLAFDWVPNNSNWSLAFNTSYTQIQYRDICERVTRGVWQSRFNDVAQHPYVIDWKNRRWILYDDVQSANAKVNNVAFWIAGGMLYDVSSDDFDGKCGPRNVLTKAVHIALLAKHKVLLQEQRLLPTHLQVGQYAEQFEGIENETFTENETLEVLA